MNKLLFDAVIIILSVIVAVYLSHLGVVDMLLSLLQGNVLLLSLLTGALFTSMFTTPIAIATFIELVGEGNMLLIALVGGLGAVAGDFVLFSFVRDRLVKDAGELMKGKRMRHFLRFMRRRRFMRILPILGGLIIASPFPDEIGLALMGISKMKTSSFLLLSYCMNTLGILLILLVAQSL